MNAKPSEKQKIDNRNQRGKCCFWPKLKVGEFAVQMIVPKSFGFDDPCFVQEQGLLVMGKLQLRLSRFQVQGVPFLTFRGRVWGREQGPGLPAGMHCTIAPEP